MSDMMAFPDTVEEFMENYKIVDTDEVYTNGAELVPIFRMKQWFEHLPSAQPERKTGRWIDAVLPNDNGGLPVQVCDQCNTFFPLAYTGGGHRFCPNCGAKMEGGADGI